MFAVRVCVGGCTFGRFDERGGDRVGYFRAVLVADSCEAFFAAFDVEAPILNFCIVNCYASVPNNRIGCDCSRP